MCTWTVWPLCCVLTSIQAVCSSSHMQIPIYTLTGRIFLCVCVCVSVLKCFVCLSASRGHFTWTSYCTDLHWQTGAGYVRRKDSKRCKERINTSTRSDICMLNNALELILSLFLQDVIQSFADVSRRNISCRTTSTSIKKTVTIPYDVFYFRVYFCCLSVVKIGFMWNLTS